MKGLRHGFAALFVLLAHVGCTAAEVPASLCSTDRDCRNFNDVCENIEGTRLCVGGCRGLDPRGSSTGCEPGYACRLRLEGFDVSLGRCVAFEGLLGDTGDACESTDQCRSGHVCVAGRGCRQYCREGSCRSGSCVTGGGLPAGVGACL